MMQLCRQFENACNQAPPHRPPDMSRSVPDTAAPPAPRCAGVHAGPHPRLHAPGQRPGGDPGADCRRDQARRQGRLVLPRAHARPRQGRLARRDHGGAVGKGRRHMPRDGRVDAHLRQGDKLPGRLGSRLRAAAVRRRRRALHPPRPAARPRRDERRRPHRRRVRRRGRRAERADGGVPQRGREGEPAPPLHRHRQRARHQHLHARRRRQQRRLRAGAALRRARHPRRRRLDGADPQDGARRGRLRAHEGARHHAGAHAPLPSTPSPSPSPSLL